MPARLRSRLTYANVASSFALFIALTTGGAYAANEWTGTNIVDGSLTYADLATNTIGSARILDNSLLAQDLAPDSVGSSEIANSAVGPGEIANETLTGAEIANGFITSLDLGSDSVGASEIATNAVGSSELANNAVDGAAVADETLTGRDLLGGGSNGTISLTAGWALNGRCNEFDASIPGAAVGDAVVFSINGTLPEGVLLYGVKVPAPNKVTVKACNFTGGTAPAFADVHVAVFTLRLG